MNLIDKIGERFGKLRVVSRKDGKWECDCDCGEKIFVSGSNLKMQGGTRSCGCARIKDMTGQRYTRLTVISLIDSPKGYPRWLCLCDCGKEHEAYGHLLRSADIKSCGCYQSDRMKMPQERVDDYISMYLEGFTGSEIAEKYKLASESYVYEILKNNGIAPTYFKSRDIQTPKIWASQYRFGLSIQEIAKKSKVNFQKVKYWLKKEGFDTIQDRIDKRNRKRKQEAEILFEVYQKGYSAKEVADIFDLSHSYTWNILKEFHEDSLRDRAQVRKLAYQKDSALTNNSQSVYIATDRDDLKPISHKTKDLTWGQDDNAINRRVHIL